MGQLTDTKSLHMDDVQTKGLWYTRFGVEARTGLATRLDPLYEKGLYKRWIRLRL
jgi:hypothetical protein